MHVDVRDVCMWRLLAAAAGSGLAVNGVPMVQDPSSGILVQSADPACSAVPGGRLGAELGEALPGPCGDCPAGSWEQQAWVCAACTSLLCWKAAGLEGCLLCCWAAVPVYSSMELGMTCQTRRAC